VTCNPSAAAHPMCHTAPLTQRCSVRCVHVLTEATRAIDNCCFAYTLREAVVRLTVTLTGQNWLAVLASLTAAVVQCSPSTCCPQQGHPTLFLEAAANSSPSQPVLPSHLLLSCCWTYSHRRGSCFESPAAALGPGVAAWSVVCKICCQQAEQRTINVWPALV